MSVIEKRNVRIVSIVLENGLMNSANDRFWILAGAMVKFGKYKWEGKGNVIPEKEWYEEYLEMEEKKNKIWEFIILNKLDKKSHFMKEY